MADATNEGLAFLRRPSRKPLGAEDVWAWTEATERPRRGQGQQPSIYELGGEFRKRRQGRRGTGV